MKGVLTIVLCFLLFISIVLAILFHDRIRGLKKKLKQAADERAARKQAKEDEYFKRTSNKYYQKDSTPQFKDDYFKTQEEEPKPEKEQVKHKKKESAARHTVNTGSGVTIIDDRNTQKSDRKIFDDNEGEYVDFVEVKS